MRPVRFVALSEDGQALVLADEVGRLLALPRDERLMAALRADAEHSVSGAGHSSGEATSSLSPRDIQARIRGGESADEVARIAGVPVDRVLRYAGPVLQERAMVAQHARRTRLKSSDRGATLAEVVDSRLEQHGVDAEKISWDAYRRDDGVWRVIATWPSGKATAQAVWELDKTRTQVAPFDDMAQYLCAERPTPILGQEDDDPAQEHEPLRRPGRIKREPSRGGHGLPIPADEITPRRPTRDPIRSGRDALLASLDRPLGTSGRGLDAPAAAAAMADTSRKRGSSPFEDDSEPAKESPVVPSLAVLRPRRTSNDTGESQPRKRGPSWDEVLFGSPPNARESS
jgi:hypothetical protein